MLKVGLAIPILDHIPGEAFINLMCLPSRITKSGHDFWLCPSLNVSPHDRAREAIIDRAIGEGIDLLWFVDSDMIIPTDAFDKLLIAMDYHQATIVSGHAYQRSYPYYTCWSKIVGGRYNYVDFNPLSMPTEIDSCGLACALVDLRRVRLHKLEQPLFQITNEKSVVVWEDSHFCFKVREAGGTIIAHPGVRCGHLSNREVVEDSSVEHLKMREFVKGGDNVTFPEIKFEDFKLLESYANENQDQRNRVSNNASSEAQLVHRT